MKKQTFVIEVTLDDGGTGYFEGKENGTCSTCLKQAQHYSSEEEAIEALTAFFGPGIVKSGDPIVVQVDD